MSKTGFAAKAAAVLCACALTPILVSQQASATGNPPVKPSLTRPAPPTTTTSPAPAGPTVKAWHHADVYSGPSSRTKVLSWVAAGAEYPALCWTTGENVTSFDPPITNNHWVMLPLHAGGLGYVWAGALKGDATGNVRDTCATES
jgi:hypothetical protein